MFVSTQKIKIVAFFIYAILFTACTNHHIGYVNPGKLIEGYHGTAVKRQTLTSQAKVWQANLDSLSRELEASPAAQRSTQEQQFLQYRQVLEQKVQTEEARINQEILLQINAYIKQHGKEHSYDFILGATENGNIVYAAEGKDITGEILTGMNQQYDAQLSVHK